VAVALVRLLMVMVLLATIVLSELISPPMAVRVVAACPARLLAVVGAQPPKELETKEVPLLQPLLRQQAMLVR